MDKIKLIGVTRVRNEEEIIQATLDHAASFVDGIIFVDDASTDNTRKIAGAHPAVLEIIKNKNWVDTPRGRNEAEGSLRQLGYEAAVAHGAEWVYYFDADEFIYFDYGIPDLSADAYAFRLFDFYITEDDKDKTWHHRRWLGAEYRDIVMMFKVNPNIQFYQREPNGYGETIKIAAMRTTL